MQEINGKQTKTQKEHRTKTRSTRTRTELATGGGLATREHSFHAHADGMLLNPPKLLYQPLVPRARGRNT